ncbi:hypothetical protein K440DRAFT_485903, partial [Wilcoxina mikolae CBS 423.85]
EPTFVTEPLKRGTIGLLWSCAVTYGICIWTTIHPDITYDSGRWRRVSYKLAWAISAILVPECIFIIALSQFRDAIYLRKLWCEIFPDTFGLQGGFFVLMGGFTTQTTRDGTIRTHTVTRDGFVELVKLAKQDMILEESKEVKLENFKKTILSCSQNPFEKKDIDDKGKADSISKALVTGQVLWMLFQCTGRKIERLPITVLETHVAIQIVYSIIIYALW